MLGKYKDFYLPVGLIVLLIIVQYLTPSPINWTITFARKDKNPFGAYVLDKQLTTVFAGQKVRDFRQPVLELEERENVNLLVLTEELGADSSDVISLIDFVEQGNTALLAASGMYGVLADTLKIGMDFMDMDAMAELKPGIVKDSVGLRFTNPALAPANKYYFEKSTAYAFFHKWDTANATVLAVNSQQKPVLLSMPCGKGRFIISSTPLVFSNYYLLDKQSSGFAEGILSYLPDRDIAWSSYYHLGRQEAGTPLRYVLGQPSLKWAYYVGMIGLLLFVVFESKRKQRPIPVVKPLPNDTVGFIKTVGAFYMEQVSHSYLARKKVVYFLEHIRSTWHLSTERLDNDFCKQLATKSGKEEKDIRALLKLINYIKQHTNISADMLLQLNNKIEHFHQKN
jgi:hypothetical protein